LRPIPEASVIICTHNPRTQYLVRVLAALRAQTLPVGDWELLLVDNASHEPLTLAGCDLSWHPCVRLVREEELGVSAARLRGMREATSEILVFVDDDNVLAADYLAEALRIGREWPILGAWGSGQTAPEFEVDPPPHLLQFMDMLALRDVKSPRWSNVIPAAGALPWGAGQCVRQSVARAYGECVLGPGIRIMGRRGQTLSSAEDVEIDFVACRMGFGVGIFPELRLTHLIPKERLSEDYLVRLAEGVWISAKLMEYKWQNFSPQSPFAGPLGLLRVIKQVIYRRGIQRRMYLAWIRAALRARAIILEHEAMRTA